MRSPAERSTSLAPLRCGPPRWGEDSSIQRMIRLVQSADAGKAKIVGLADRWATWIVVIALSAAAITWLVTTEIIRAVTILVVFCPCALVLATPTAIMAAIGNATRHGFLVREGDALERLSRVKRVAFDKTGTLTYGAPEVVAVEAASPFDRETVYRLAAGAEQLSEHPLGKAIARCWGKEHGQPLPQPAGFTMLPGRGVTAQVEAAPCWRGTPNSWRSRASPWRRPQRHSAAGRRAATLTYVAVDGRFAGTIALSDTLREESAAMVAQLTRLGVRPVLLTGDHENAAKAIADRLGIGEVRANCLPEDKLTAIGGYQDAGELVCMMGDGINDAPA